MSLFSGFSSIGKIPELRRRVVFTLALLAVYRFGVFVTTPGVDRTVMNRVVSGQGGLLGLFNLFSGGALGNLSIFALGIMPYVSASIIMQLMGLVSRQVEEMRKEGDSGRRKLEQWTRYGTLLLSLFQSFGVAMMLEGMNNTDMGGGRIGDVVTSPGWGFRLMTMMTLTTGTLLIMWMGEQITDRGVGNGSSLIIFIGIVANVPNAVGQFWSGTGGDVQPLTVAMITGTLVVAIAVVCLFERAQRRIPIQYARRQVDRRIYGGQQAHLPLRVNMASMIPPIFASSLLMFPATLQNMKIPGMQELSSLLNRGDWMFHVMYAILIVFFTFFYTAVTFQPVDVADNLKKQQANIPGIRPGRQTAEYIDAVISRITVGGSIYLAAICIFPTLVFQAFRVPFQFGGTSLIIVVGTALETFNQLEAHLISRSYEGLSGPAGSRLSGRRPA
jgi:preprotein translocase subunit SecY